MSWIDMSTTLKIGFCGSIYRDAETPHQMNPGPQPSARCVRQDEIDRGQMAVGGDWLAPQRGGVF
jgi:hypothetical protein